MHILIVSEEDDMPRIQMIVSDELLKLIQRYQRDHKVTESRAAAALAALGAASEYGENVEPSAPHGDARRIHRMAEYLQCPQCGGWNVGKLEGVKYCADCGFRGAAE